MFNKTQRTRFFYTVIIVGFVFLSFVIVLFSSCLNAYSLKKERVLTSNFMKMKQSQDPSLAIKQTWISLDDLSLLTIKAILLSEDPKFLDHHGISLSFLRSAIKKNLKSKSLNFGASTITQQVAKNMFLSSTRSFFRKTQELFIAFAMEYLISKKRILEIYINIAEWGPGIFGLEEAARYWFKKSASKLTAYEALRIAFILPSPLTKTPYNFDEISESRFMLSYHYLYQNRGILMEDLLSKLK